MARQLLLTTFLAILAAGHAQQEVKLANCRSALAALSTRSPLEVSAMCRSALPSETCRDALKDLGASPWTPDKVAVACQKYVPLLASLGESKGRFLDDIAAKLVQTGASTAIDPATGKKVMTVNPWTPQPKGHLPFPIPALFTGVHPPKPKDQSFKQGGNTTFPSMPPLPESLAPTDCLGSVTFAVHEIAGFHTDPVFQDAIIRELAATGDVAPSLVHITACHITPFTQSNGVMGVGGNVEIFFSISTGDTTRSKIVEQRFEKCNHQEFGYHMWNYMTSHGSNHHTMLIMEGVEAKPVASMKATIKVTPTHSPFPKLPKLPLFAPFTMPVPAAPTLPPTPAPAPPSGGLLAGILAKAKPPQAKAPPPAPTPAPKKPLPFPLFTPKIPAAPKAAPKPTSPASPAPLASKVASAAKGLSKLLGKKPAAAPTLLQETKTIDDKKGVVMKTEVHKGQTMAKEGSMAATWATGMIVGAVCVMGAIMLLTKVWRRGGISYRSVHLQGGPSDAPEVPPTVTEALNADRDLE